MNYLINYSHMTINELLSVASEKLSESFKNYRAALEVFKNLKKDLKNELKTNSEWVEIEDQIKLLKTNRRDIWEQIKDLQKRQDQIAITLEQYEEVQNFSLEMEDKFSDKKDKELNSLSKNLAEKWILAEVEYRNNGQLLLIVAKHS